MKKPGALILVLGLLTFATAQAGETLTDAIQRLQQQWAIAKYQTPEDQQDKVFTALTQESEQVTTAFPNAAAPLVWQAIIVSSHAGATGGLGALRKVKHARKLLESAEHIDPNALHGSVYTSLGSLYYQVPGWPIGFGDKKKAESYLQKALAENPNGIDPNYFYGDFLLDQKRYDEAVEHLTRAMEAPARPQRPIADEGRRDEVQQALKTARANLRH